jgi:hypothetical protein
LRPPPSPPRRRRPAALPPLAARLAAEPPIPNVGPSGHAQKNRFFAARSRQAASTAHRARSQTENHFLESRSTSASVASAAAAVLFRNSKIGIGFHRLKGDKKRFKAIRSLG